MKPDAADRDEFRDDFVSGRDRAVHDQPRDHAIAGPQRLPDGFENTVNRRDAVGDLHRRGRGRGRVAFAVDEQHRLELSRERGHEGPDCDGAMVVVFRDDFFGVSAVREVAELERDSVVADLALRSDLDRNLNIGMKILAAPRRRCPRS
jgi:hypothetical protein